MFIRLHLVVLGVVVFHGAGLNAMDKELKSPRNSDNKELATMLRASAEIKKQEQELKKITNPMPIPSVGHGEFHRYPGSHSPVESWIPYYHADLNQLWVSDCP